MAFIDADKLSYEIFSFLESKFLFTPSTTASPAISSGAVGRIRVLSIDGGDRPSDVLLAAAALDRLEATLRLHTGEPCARVADLFDVAAGSGAGGVLAAMLFTRGHDGRPLFSAADALRLLVAESRRRRGRGFACSRGGGLFRGVFRRPGGFFRRVFGDATLRDAVKPILIPCYDLATAAPFLFSRADAVEADGYDFRTWEVCAATCADTTAVEMRSMDGRTRVAAVGGGVVMANPTAAAITHVLHNKQEFPLATGLEDLLVVSLGAAPREPVPTGAAELLRIASDGVADMVDQAVAMAFGHGSANNYTRIQANNLMSGNCTPHLLNSKNLMRTMEDIFSQRHVESFLFSGKRLSEQSNAHKLDHFASELIKEEERRKKNLIPIVVIKQVMTPRTSSATTITTTVTTTATTMSPVH
ncbi:patatin-like protein 3 [Zingiber officinale]|uniref:patatin-like protein 3 n=1 Tax=Zingiber officinale TaxID=94328 RepID=UPI001C4CDC38|nr:patatin-like protein 3 [Zingiber officinale]